MLKTGDVAPDFLLPTDDGGQLCLREAGSAMVLFFYPKDDTPGCTTEAIEFTAQQHEFEKLDVLVVGASPDSGKKHEKFKAKHDLKIMLLSDEQKTVLDAYGVWVEKSMYGRKYMGVERSTFLIDSDKVIVAVWRKVKVKGHVEEVLATAQTHFGGG